MKQIKRQKIIGKKKIEDMTETEAAVIAMLIDTDGCISVNPSNHPHLVTGMCSLIPIKMVVEWGGTIHKGRTRGGQKRHYVWSLYKHNLVQAMLEKIKPYLQQKQQQAESALQIFKLSKLKEKGWKDKVKVLGDQIRFLNQTCEPPEIDLKTLEGAIPDRNLDAEILEILAKTVKPLSTQQLADLLNASRGCIRHRMIKLAKLGKVKIIEKRGVRASIPIYHYIINH